MAEESETIKSTIQGGQLKLECPFDLETVFTMQYSTEGLKGVLSWIIDNLGDVKTGLGNLDNRVAEQIKNLNK